MNPAFLLMQVLSNKRSGLTAQYVDQISEMNKVNKQAESLRNLMALIRAAKTEDGLSEAVFKTKVEDKFGDQNPDFSGPEGTGVDKSLFDTSSYVVDGKFSSDKLTDMVEDLRNKIASLNNLNSQTQIKIKMTEQYRNETIEWENSLLDKIGRVFEKINQN